MLFKLHRVGLVLVAMVAVAAVGAEAAPVTYVVDVEASHVNIHVGKGGLLSIAGHEHDVRPTDFSGEVSLDEEVVGNSSLTLTFPAKMLRVAAEHESEEQAAEVTETMHGPDCLDVDRYPNIRFESSDVEGRRTSDGFMINLRGVFEIHGVRKARDIPVEVVLDGDQLRAKGKLSFKQSDHGITPVTAVGGTIKVKDELELTFDIVAQKKEEPAPAEPAPNPAPPNAAATQPGS